MIFAIKPFEIHDGDGIRTTVFFKGCPLRCKWCHNPESFSMKPEILYDPTRCKNCLRCTSLCEANTAVDGKHIFNKDLCTLCGKCDCDALELCGKEYDMATLTEELLKDSLFFKASGGGVTFSGGEPLLQPTLCADLAKALKEQGVSVALDTCGCVPRENLEQVLPYVDQILFDIKAIDEQVHIACTGASNKQILENLRYIDTKNIPVEIRYPYVPTMNDGEAENIADFVKELKNLTLVRVLPYHDYAEAKYNRCDRPFTPFPVPTKAEIEKVLNLFSGKNIPAETF